MLEMLRGFFPTAEAPVTDESEKKELGALRYVNQLIAPRGNMNISTILFLKRKEKKRQGNHPLFYFKEENDKSRRLPFSIDVARKFNHPHNRRTPVPQTRTD